MWCRTGGGSAAADHRCLDVLGLASLAVGRGDDGPGDGVGGMRAEVAADDVQAQVDAAGHPGRGEYVSVVDVEHVRVYVHQREVPGQLVGVQPVCRGPATVEHARFGQRERTRADGDQAAAASVCLTQHVHHGRRHPSVWFVPRHDHGVGGRYVAQVAGNGQGETGGRRDDAAHPAHGQPVRGTRPGAEDLRRDGQIQRKHGIQGQDGHVVRGHGRQGRHGSNLTNTGITATRAAVSAHATIGA